MIIINAVDNVTRSVHTIYKTYKDKTKIIQNFSVKVLDCNERLLSTHT